MALPRERPIEKPAALAGIQDLDLFLEEQRRRLTELCGTKLHDEDAADEVTQRVLIKFLEFLSKASASQLRTANLAGWLTAVASNECIQFFRDRKSRLKQRDATSRAKRREIYASDLPEFGSAESADGNDSAENLEEQDSFKSVLDAHVMARARDMDWSWFDCDAWDLGILTKDERATFILRHPDLTFWEEDWNRLLGKDLAGKVRSARGKWLEAQDLARDQKPEKMPEKQIAVVLGMKRGTVSSHLARAREKLVESHSRGDSAQYKLRRMRKETPKRPLGKSRHDELRHGPVRTIPIGSISSAILAPGLPSQPRNFPGPKRDQRGALRKIAYKCGSYFKGCLQCGDWEWQTIPAKRRVKTKRRLRTKRRLKTKRRPKTKRGVKEVKRYKSGFDVWRAYVPSRLGWTFWCYECGAKDEACWEKCQDQLGKEP